MIVETEISDILNRLEGKATRAETKEDIKDLRELVEDVLDDNERLEEEVKEIIKDNEAIQGEKEREYDNFLRMGGRPVDWMIREMENA